MASFDFRSVNSDVLGLAFGLVLAGVQKFWRGYQDGRTETWPISHGRIDRVTLDTEHRKIKLKCYYTYRVGEESFVGSFLTMFQDPEEAEAWNEALQKKNVPVRYDPQKPARSRLRASDLEFIVRSTASAYYTRAAEAPTGVKVFVAKICSVLAALGLAISGLILVDEYTSKQLVTAGVASIVVWAGLPLFFAGIWVGGGDKLSAKLPDWMKYLGYALLYFAIFSTFLSPKRHPNNSHHGWVDARYQLFLYFTALECCYIRLSQRNENEHPMSGTLHGSSLK